ncbi:MAG: hypothetical protein AAFX05_10680 [Planctomycetota bacterium]
MVTWNLVAAWAGILLGMLSGAALGLGFRGDTWLGGYGSWARRLLRLGHISFFGIALLNIAFVATVERIGGGTWATGAGVLLLAGAASMPTVCALAACRKSLHWLFAIPVLSLLGAAAVTLWMSVHWAMGGVS